VKRIVPPLILASASPRRSELLRAAGIPHDILVSHVDESMRHDEAADAYVCRLAREKATAVLSRADGRPVLGADTAVVIEGHVLGKPVDAEDAVRMLRLLAGRTHDVLTGVALIAPGSDATARQPHVRLRLARTAVEFAELDDSAIAAYVASGEPMDKAGSYAIQGIASRFVTRISGSYSNVVGLPVALVWEMLSELEADRLAELPPDGARTDF
jgi:septum formation protein